MKLETKAFELCNGKYANLAELVRAMGISVSRIYWVRPGRCPVNEKFITGTIKAFSGYMFDNLFMLPGTEARMTTDKVHCYFSFSAS